MRAAAPYVSQYMPYPLLYKVLRSHRPQHEQPQFVTVPSLVRPGSSQEHQRLLQSSSLQQEHQLEGTPCSRRPPSACRRVAFMAAAVAGLARPNVAAACAPCGVAWNCAPASRMKASRQAVLHRISSH